MLGKSWNNVSNQPIIIERGYEYLESRSSPLEVFLLKASLEICNKITGEHPCQSVICTATLLKSHPWNRFILDHDLELNLWSIFPNSTFKEIYLFAKPYLFSKFSVSVISIIFPPKPLIWNKKMLPASNYFSLRCVKYRSLSKVIGVEILWKHTVPPDFWGISVKLGWNYSILCCGNLLKLMGNETKEDFTESI